MDKKLIKDFETSHRGSHTGVQLLNKQAMKGNDRNVKYLVKWKARPEKENSWEKEATISRERITEFEAR